MLPFPILKIFAYDRARKLQTDPTYSTFTQTLSTRSLSKKGNLMLKTIKITSTTGNQEHILKLFKEYVIDILKKAGAVAEEKGQELLPQVQKSDWQWVTDSSPAELLETVSWSWNSRPKEDGATGSCTIYLKSDEQIRSYTSEKLLEGNAVYNVEITIVS